MKVARIAAVSAVFLLFSVGRAHAYLDAGSGSMLIQLLLGGTAGLVVLVKLYWRRFLSFFGMREPASSASPNVDAERGD